LAAGWTIHHWSAGGGYGRAGSSAMENRHNEALFFSPHCLDSRQASLFGGEQKGGEGA